MSCSFPLRPNPKLITKSSNRTINHQSSHRFYRFIFNVIAVLDIKKNIKLDTKKSLDRNKDAIKDSFKKFLQITAAKSLVN